MPRYVGLDVHKQLIEACFIDEDGKQLHRCCVAGTRESSQTFVAKCLQPSDHVVMETTPNTWEVAELILPQVAKVAIANRTAVKRNRNYQTSQMGRDHAQDEAEELVRIGLKKYKLKEEALERLPGSDERKVAIAESIHRNTTVSQAWIAERLA